MKFVKIAQTTDLPSGSKTKIVVNGQTILLVNYLGIYYALDNTCPHMGGSLVDGQFVDGRIICPRHGTTFDVQSGQVLQGAKILFFKFQVRDAKTYPVYVEGSDILVGIA